MLPSFYVNRTFLFLSTIDTILVCLSSYTMNPTDILLYVPNQSVHVTIRDPTTIIVKIFMQMWLQKTYMNYTASNKHIQLKYVPYNFFSYANSWNIVLIVDMIVLYICHSVSK